MNADEFREVGHRTVDLLSDYLEHIEERPLFADVEPAKLNNLFAEPLPQNPSASAEVLQEIQEKLLPYCTHVGHPGYLGLITPSPNSMGSSRTSFAPRSTKMSERTRLGRRQ
jgi:aromatic-L-amino-acid/L-tryptophan decarboxylase